MDIAARVLRATLIQLVYQRAHQGSACGVGGAQDQGVAAGLCNQSGFVVIACLSWCGGCACSSCASVASGLNQTRNQRRQVDGDGVFERDDFDFAGVRHI